MFLRTSTWKSTKTCSDNINRLKKELETADAIVIGAGAGLSASAGMSYDGERFEKYFSDFHRKYGITDMYSGGFYPFDTFEEYWAWWSRHILVNRYEAGVGKPYTDLLELVKDKDYFVLTTNVDHQFQLAGFDKKRLFYTQGDYGLWQCSKPCHSKTYDNEEAVRQMVNEQKDMKIPSELVPHCPICGAPMNVNLRCDDTFVEDKGWHAASERYSLFLRRHQRMRTLFLELG
ncbi:MAG: Sir2 silent information regulator family NAD-dependent deacetylase, partial [Clostridiales bacterium]|nr:Sir2 silent information regulator family NAD-dependent deacetylase [Clostridiales bacterium]